MNVEEGHDEIERRFLITELSPKFPFNTPKTDIEQAYVEIFPTKRAWRIRIEDGLIASLTSKLGKGRVRREIPFPLELSLARHMFQSASFRLYKTRHKSDSWEIDFFRDVLSGVILAELEMLTPDSPCVLPPWIGKGIEVTDSLTNLHLARIAALLKPRNQGQSALKFILSRLKKRIVRILLTGGPGSGKSGIMELLKPEMPDFQFVPEVASILIGQAGIHPGKTAGSVRRFQTTLYPIQVLFETTSTEIAMDDGKKGLVLDRGRVDAAVYFSGGVEEYEKVLGTTVTRDYGEYDLVICLAVPPPEIYEIIRLNNPARGESYSLASYLGGEIREVWQNHHNFAYIPNLGSWEEKVAMVRSVIREFLIKQKLV